MATINTSRLPWTGIDPVEWLRMWQTVWRGAPNALVQPILPGWTFNINSNNSSSPQTEVDIVALHSYGRQLGRIGDVLELLIAERPRDAAKNKKVSDFLEMKRQIDKAKEDAAADRIQQIIKDLSLLKAQDQALYARLRDQLRAALK